MLEAGSVVKVRVPRCPWNGKAKVLMQVLVIMGLYTLCHQAYVDIHGSALLYRLKKFEFQSSYQMLNVIILSRPLRP